MDKQQEEEEEDDNAADGSMDFATDDYGTGDVDGDGDGDGDGETTGKGGAMMDDNPEEDEMFQDSLGFLKLKKKWLQKEEELRKKRAEERAKLCESTEELRQKKVTQIFSTAAATGVLTNDLKNLMFHSSDSLGISAEPVDDNIYDWRVKLFNFAEGTHMAKDMEQIKKLYGYNDVELRIEFALDLYPFYPPTVRVVRPRFVGFMMGRVTSMEILRLQGWDPIKNMTEVLQMIRKLLEEHGKVDVNNPMNDPQQNPAGAYTELEFHLLRLELLCETPARVHAKYPELASPANTPTPPPKKQVSTSSSSSANDKLYWAKGVGYGHGDTHNSTWDVNAYLAAQQQKDEETAGIFAKIAAALRDDIAKFPPPGSSSIPFDVIEESCLIPVLESYLRNDSIFDMIQHVSLYLAVLDVCNALAGREQWLPLFEPLSNQTKSVFELLKLLYQQAKTVLKAVSPLPNDPNTSIKLSQMISTTYSLIEGCMEKRAASIKELEAAAMSSSSSSPSAAAPTAGTSAATQRPDEIYCNAMKALQFDSVKMNLAQHHYASYRVTSTASPGLAVNKSKVMRLAQEQASIAVSLPLTIDSSIFVRVDEDNMDFMKVLITGPMASDYGSTSTPYAGGCFAFDVYFPSNYPQVPPMVNLMTTGQGRIRFNPNLYNCGKVCLSLLGTWSGSEGENWNPKTSTLLQVLVSIQSLILVPQPFFNEPGYEREMNTPAGDRKSHDYNNVIRAGTIEHAIIGQLRSPAAGFEEVIRRHFYLQQNRIIEQCNRWLTEPQPFKSNYSTLLRLVTEMKAEFAKLSFPFPKLPA